MISLGVTMGLSSLPFYIPLAQASHGGDDWAPLGPYVDKVLITIFEDCEICLLQAWLDPDQHFDLPNWPVPADSVTQVCSDSRLNCEFYNELGMWGLDFNNNPRNKWFGVISGFDDQAVTEIKRAIAHLLDKDEQISVALSGLGRRLDAVLPGFQYLWAEPFDSLHQGQQTLQELRFDDSSPNSVFVSVSDSSSDVFLVHISGNETKEGLLGGYAGLCHDGGECASVTAAQRHPGPDGVPGTTDDEFNFNYAFYDDAAKDGLVRFDSVTDSKTGAKVPLPSGTYIVYAVNDAAGRYGWGYMSYPAFNTVFVDISNPLSSGGWYDRTPYPDPGYEEFCEARDHLVLVHADIDGDGVPDRPFKDSDDNCRIDKDSAIFSAQGYQQLRIWRRSDTARGEMGARLMDRMRTLFGGNNVLRDLCPPGSGADCTPFVFFGDPIDDWDLYTMGWRLSRDFDYIDELYNMQSGYAPCGTTSDPSFTPNYGSFCDPLFSSAARATENTLDPTGAKLATFLHGFALGSIPVWAAAGFQAYNNAWTGVVNQVGTGVRSLYSVLNMYPVKDCAAHSRLLFQDMNSNGCWDFGESLTMRWTFISDLQQLNPLQSQWFFDWEVLGLIYDTLQAVNPYGLQDDYSSMAQSWTNFPSPTAAQLGYDPPAGTALTQRWFVKNHLVWDDGKPVTGKDVVFSLLAHKEVDYFGSYRFGATVRPVNFVRLVSDVPQQIVVDVGFDSDSPVARAGHIAGVLPIVPCNVYSTGNLGYPDLPNCGGITVGTTMPAMGNGNFTGVNRDLFFDPTFVPDDDGDGVPESDCDDLGTHRTGHKGSGPYLLDCTSNGRAAVGLGGTILLRSRTVDKSEFANSREYWGSPHNYLVWRWADFNNNGVVGTDDKARTRLNPPLGCRNKPVPTDQSQWDMDMDGVPDDMCTQFDFNRNGVSSDFSDRARMTLEGGKRWTPPFTWPWPGPVASGRAVVYPWVGWVWWLDHQCNGPDHTKGTSDDDKNACWFTKFATRPP